MNLPAGRDKLLALQEQFLKLEQVEPLICHHFANNVYGREMYLPAGCALVGKKHRYACINIIAEGTVKVATEHGVLEFTAPYVFVSPAGTQRAMYAVTDVTWVTCHPCQTEDLATIEEELIDPSGSLEYK